MVDNAGQTTGPVWVCDELNSRRGRSIPNCRRARSRHLAGHFGRQTHEIRSDDDHASARRGFDRQRTRPQGLPHALGRVIPAGIARHPDGPVRRNVHPRDAGAHPGRGQRNRGQGRKENDLHGAPPAMPARLPDGLCAPPRWRHRYRARCTWGSSSLRQSGSEYRWCADSTRGRSGWTCRGRS